VHKRMYAKRAHICVRHQTAGMKKKKKIGATVILDRKGKVCFPHMFGDNDTSTRRPLTAFRRHPVGFFFSSHNSRFRRE
jgi:hypothetical protein